MRSDVRVTAPASHASALRALARKSMDATEPTNGAASSTQSSVCSDIRRAGTRPFNAPHAAPADAVCARSGYGFDDAQRAGGAIQQACPDRLFQLVLLLTSDFERYKRRAAPEKLS